MQLSPILRIPASSKDQKGYLIGEAALEAFHKALKAIHSFSFAGRKRAHAGAGTCGMDRKKQVGYLRFKWALRT